MKQFAEDNYQDIITKLKKIRAVKAPERLVAHVQKTLIPSLPISAVPLLQSSLFSMQAFAVTTLLVVTSSAGILIASQQSRSGDVLYPVKQKVEKIQQLFDRIPAIGKLLDFRNIKTKSVPEVIDFIQYQKQDLQKRVEMQLENQVIPILKDVPKIVPTVSNETLLIPTVSLPSILVK